MYSQKPIEYGSTAKGVMEKQRSPAVTGSAAPSPYQGENRRGYRIVPLITVDEANFRRDEDAPRRPFWRSVAIVAVLGTVLTIRWSLASSRGTPSSSGLTTASTLRTASQDNIFDVGNYDNKHAAKEGGSKGSDDDNANRARYYTAQVIDHFATEYEDGSKTWANRYFESTKHFAGPGNPILMVMGGESDMDHGMLYPYVNDDLAPALGAAVIQIEHRFYGSSQPVDPAVRTVQDLKRLLTPEQAMMDMIQLTNHIRFDVYGCAIDRSSPDYCPIITVGASYPGFLSAMMKIVHPDFCDIAYASAAPMLLYGEISRGDAYNDVVTDAAELLYPGCNEAVLRTLEWMSNEIDNQSESLRDAATKIGVCPDNISSDIVDRSGLRDKMLTLVRDAFSYYNADAYPPSGSDNPTYKACEIFTDDDLTDQDSLRTFFYFMKLQEEEEANGCDMAGVQCEQKGPMPENFCFDASDDGIELGNNDYMWTFQTCSKPIFLSGASEHSMFPVFVDNFERLRVEECLPLFGPDIVPRPYELIQEHDYMNKLYNEARYVLFTNGLQDMWAPGSILQNISETVLALTFENGAHHSELNHKGPSDSDTDDIKQGYQDIRRILTTWLRDLQDQWKS